MSLKVQSASELQLFSLQLEALAMQCMPSAAQFNRECHSLRQADAGLADDCPALACHASGMPHVLLLLEALLLSSRIIDVDKAKNDMLHF